MIQIMVNQKWKKRFLNQSTRILDRGSLRTKWFWNGIFFSFPPLSRGVPLSIKIVWETQTILSSFFFLCLLFPALIPSHLRTYVHTYIFLWLASRFLQSPNYKLRQLPRDENCFLCLCLCLTVCVFEHDLAGEDERKMREKYPRPSLFKKIPIEAWIPFTVSETDLFSRRWRKRTKQHFYTSLHRYIMRRLDFSF